MNYIKSTHSDNKKSSETHTELVSMSFLLVQEGNKQPQIISHFDSTLCDIYYVVHNLFQFPALVYWGKTWMRKGEGRESVWNPKQYLGVRSLPRG